MSINVSSLIKKIIFIGLLLCMICTTKSFAVIYDRNRGRNDGGYGYNQNDGIRQDADGYYVGLSIDGKKRLCLNRSLERPQDDTKRFSSTGNPTSLSDYREDYIAYAATKSSNWNSVRGRNSI